MQGKDGIMRKARPYKDKTGRWRAWIVDPRTGKRKTVTGKTREVCKERFEALEEALKDESRPDGSTVNYWMQRQVEARNSSGTAPRMTAVEHRKYLHSLVPYRLAQMEIDKVTVQDVTRALKELLDSPTVHGKPRNANTVGRVRRFLIASFARALRHEVISKNVAAATDAISEGDADHRWLDVDQARRLLKALESHPWYALYLVLATVGLRRSEVLAMRWDALDLETGRLTVAWTLVRTNDSLLLHKVTKTDASARTVTLPAVAVTALRNHRDEWGQVTDWVWSQPMARPGVAGEPRATPHDLPHPDALKGPLGRACLELGLEPLTPHDLRHTAATIALAAGADSRVVMDLLGHKDPRMMAIYQHVLDSVREGTAAQIDALWREAG